MTFETNSFFYTEVLVFSIERMQPQSQNIPVDPKNCRRNVCILSVFQNNSHSEITIFHNNLVVCMARQNLHDKYLQHKCLLIQLDTFTPQLTSNLWLPSIDLLDYSSTDQYPTFLSRSFALPRRSTSISRSMIEHPICLVPSFYHCQ